MVTKQDIDGILFLVFSPAFRFFGSGPGRDRRLMDVNAGHCPG